jgi:hypothetical protein
MSGHRHAASVLYGVSAPDQEAVLASLPQADQHILRAHLRELRTLGFDPAALRTATAEIAPPAPATPVARLHAAGAGAMRTLIADEPDGLLADVLAMEPWPWTAPLLATLPAGRRVALRMQDERAAPTPAMRALLLAELASMVAALPVHAAQVPAAPATTRRTLAQRWAAWTR